MKRNYEQPMMYAEAFVPNEAVSACTVNSEFKYTFDCMRGKDVDSLTGAINSSIASGCSYQIGYQSGCSAARNYDFDGKPGHSNNNASSVTATWTSNDSYIQVVYSGSNIDGLLYANSDSSRRTNNWSYSGGYMVHSDANGDDGKHVMVAPVVNAQSVNASW